MSTANTTVNAEREAEAEAAVSEFLEMRAAILGRLSPETLRCVAVIFERRVEESKKRRDRASDTSVTTEMSEAPSRQLDMLL